MRTDDDPAQLHRVVADGFRAVADATPAGGWDAPAPVAGWAARDVVRHLVEWFPPFLAGGAGVRLPAGPPVDADPAAAWRAQAESVQALLDDPTTADRVLVNPHLGEVPLPEAVARFYVADVFMHTWDLARAVGLGGPTAGLDPTYAAQLLAGMEPIEEVLRTSAQYGARVPAPADADPVTALMAFVGRDPAFGTPDRG
ncbi:maleylpyruvate isomerase N-terminal domain-containing protein [Nocardioides litoris]|uniref:maleylpyruvate isomerase N-terminal domain-containing protein n=1 Tax=Nocardioides litoris TaxID=1926648 RepID=UPI001124C1A1|nr:maleylpyruvate isomerase N-terminal domain-containing protein [Nocardioides litoris]